VTDSGSGTTLDGTIATVNVAPANDVPTLTSFAGVIDSVNEDTEVEITLAELKAQGDEADVDGTVDGFVIKALSSGTLKIGSTAGTAVAFVAGVTDTVDGTNNAYWTPSLNDTGAAINAFTAVALDNNGAESSIARQAQIDVVAVNDAPSGANNTVSLDEDSNYVFVAGDFGFSDPVEGDAFSGVVVTVAPTTGSLSLTGSGIVTNGQLIGIADINAGKLVFTPVAGASGAAYSSFSFQVVDDGGTANGGVNTDQTSNAMTINVDPVVVLVPPPEPDPEPDPDPEPEPPPPIIDPGPDPDPEPDPEPEPDVEEAEADDEADSEEDTGDDDEASDNGALDLSALYLADTIFSDGDNNDPTTAGAGVIRVSLQSIVGSIAMQSPAFSAGLIPTIVLDDETAVTEDSILDVNSNFNRDLDRMKENTEQGSGVNANTVGTAVVVTTGVSVGYVIWLIRSGVLLSSVLSALPAWRLIDPLPVLSFMMHKSDDEDDESLETIVESSTEENNNEEK
ncbi:MAG: hypothetical protein OQL16_01670, partial [Gammaproteobacteria bacterium]|nr:hypothetical protein [Gammaproteobacteria bacterium]